ncbi:cytochrome c-type biogenesis protein [Oceanomicrobium pacificus]|uniref:Cytochrome c-type biogenesis protein n=1 Tax=Oceanomicrobium pacificus TaxID=2692916 RepID=A0A6B0TX48_9RHOB|nr:cytochrome c-type biogenesis protein [Oceanomicrobium pacificus]MXU66295.1 cytochrome C biogenesis protein CcdA [Oceanomicrobium pacificus]
MRIISACLAVLLLLGPGGVFTGPAAAVEVDEILDDPALEARARDLSKELRCLVCRNESIDESNADLARDLRILVRERLVAGDTDDEVIAYLVDRYGDYVLLKPRIGGGNLILWLAAPALLLAGGGIAFVFIRRRAPAFRAEEELSADEEERLAELLKQ